MAQERKEAGNQPEIKRLDQLELELRTIAAKYRCENYDRAVFATAEELVHAAILNAASAILRARRLGLDVVTLAENARRQWWEFMVKPKGGFQRYDGTRPFAPYGFVTLKRICLGRANLQVQFHRRITARKPDNERQNPNGLTRGTDMDRRQVPLDFDPVDPRSTDRAARQQGLVETVSALLNELTADQQEALILRYLYGANLSAVARQRGITAEHFTCGRITLGKRYVGGIRDSSGRNLTTGGKESPRGRHIRMRQKPKSRSSVRVTNTATSKRHSHFKKGGGRMWNLLAWIFWLLGRDENG